jgi:hypothetical protein
MRGLEPERLLRKRFKSDEKFMYRKMLGVDADTLNPLALSDWSRYFLLPPHSEIRAQRPRDVMTCLPMPRLALYPTPMGLADSPPGIAIPRAALLDVTVPAFRVTIPRAVSGLIDASFHAA